MVGRGGKFLEGGARMEWVWVVVGLAVWLILQAWILPKLGVPT